MNALTICERILSDARQEAQQELSAAREKAAAIRAGFEAQAQADREQALQRARQESEEQRNNMLRMAQLDEKKLDLAMKREVLDEAFESVVQAMCQLDDDRARDFVEGLLLEAAEGECAIVVREEDAHLYDEAFLNRVNGKLQGAHVTLAEERRTIRGGFVLVSGGMEINCAYDAVVLQARSALEAQAAQALFE